MGLCASSEDPNSEEAQKAVELENELLRDRLAALFNFKVLILGAGESGKSTVVKQLKLIHNRKLTDVELKHTGDCLHKNVLDCMNALVGACKDFGYNIPEEHGDTLDLLQNINGGDRLTYDQSVSITNLFNDESIQKAYARRNEFWLLDACGYYMANLERFVEEGFSPSEEDCVMARVRTTGIQVSELQQKIIQDDPKLPDTLTFQVVDVGGQRSERKKWMHCFDNVKAILFVVNLAGYNQVLFEDPTKNRMQEALDLFSQIVNNKMFADTPIHLFLNKKDLFEKMILDTDMKHIFPEYTGGKNLQPALDYIGQQFESKVPSTKTVQIQVITAAMKRDVRHAFEEVKKELHESNMKLIEKEVKAIKGDEKKIKKKKGASV